MSFAITTQCYYRCLHRILLYGQGVLGNITPRSITRSAIPSPPIYVHWLMPCIAPCLPQPDSSTKTVSSQPCLPLDELFKNQFCASWRSQASFSTLTIRLHLEVYAGGLQVDIRPIHGGRLADFARAINVVGLDTLVRWRQRQSAESRRRGSIFEIRQLVRMAAFAAKSHRTSVLSSLDWSAR